MEATTRPAENALWYVAYGSNLSSVRLQRYLDQCLPVASPSDRCAMELPHRLFFASFSSLWGGGCAFIDPVATNDSTTYVTAWLLRTDQFLGILRRENAAPEDAVPAEPPAVAPGETAEAVDGRYGLVLGCPSPDHRRAFTFTTPERPLPVETAPSDSYLETITHGLVEGHGLSVVEAERYLSARSIRS